MTETKPPLRRPPFALLIALTTIGPTTANMFVPSMPSVASAFNVGYGTAQLTLSVYMGCFAIALLAWGPLSDRFGRRPVILASLAIYAMGSLLCLFAPGIEWLVIGRGVQAVGGCAGFSLSRAMVRDIHGQGGSARVIAYLSMAMAGGPMTAPALGGYLDVWFDWRATFVVLTVVGVVLLLVAARFLHETRPGTPKEGMIADLVSSISRLMRLRRYLGYTLQIASTSSIFFAFVGAMPLVMTVHFDQPASAYGVWFMALPVMFMTGSFIAGRAAGRAGVDTMIRVGSAIILVGAAAEVFILLAGYAQPATLFAAAAVITLGSGITQANSLAGAVGTDPRIAGAAAGLAGSLQTAANAISSLIAGLIVSGPPGPMIAMMAIGAVAAIAVHTWGTRGAADAPGSPDAKPGGG